MGLLMKAKLWQQLSIGSKVEEPIFAAIAKKGGI
tara:strand:- start:584 stop:685 length:102 start_codon:yes stop_codon:yes gene_type:complete